MKIIKLLLKIVGSLLGMIVIALVVYLAYIVFSYSRIGNQTLSPNNNSTLETVSVGSTYSCTTYNVGFGAYSQDYTFFLDTGYDDKGEATCGYYSKAKSKEVVLFNINGAIDTIESKNIDFAFFQEVDIDSTRSYHIDQNEMITNAFSSYSNVFCQNYKSSFLAYPFYDMHGASNAGLTTLSRYKIQTSERIEYTISTSFSKFIDLDRCFSVSSVKVSNGKTLHLINNHMSAYDEGGVIRSKQMEELYTFASTCYNNGDYVVIGGDFNHDLITYNPDFSYNMTNNRAYGMTKKAPDWVSYFFNEDGTSFFDNGFSVVASDNNPTCRNNDIEWIEGETFVVTVDGFIVSNNIDIVVIETIKTLQGNKDVDGFAFSDHEPVYLEFKLN